jgi:hypothetical protein
VILAVLAVILLMAGLTRLNPDWNAVHWLGIILVVLGLAAGLAAVFQLRK